MDRFIGTRVLLVEDDPAHVELALHALRQVRPGAEVIVARDGLEALDFLFAPADPEGRSARIFHLVVLDLRLPGVDGVEVLRRLKADPGTRRTPVVVLTGCGDDSQVEQAAALGVNSFVAKPADPEHLGRVVRSIGDYWLGLNENPTL